jgi:hypothetical protein
VYDDDFAVLGEAEPSDVFGEVVTVHVPRIGFFARGFYIRVDGPTDVLSFPVDEAQAAAGPRELGDIVICPEHTADIREAIVHGALHLVGMDHETDDGQMVALQAELLER